MIMEQLNLTNVKRTIDDEGETSLTPSPKSQKDKRLSNEGIISPRNRGPTRNSPRPKVDPAPLRPTYRPGLTNNPKLGAPPPRAAPQRTGSLRQVRKNLNNTFVTNLQDVVQGSADNISRKTSPSDEDSSSTEEGNEGNEDTEGNEKRRKRSSSKSGSRRMTRTTSTRFNKKKSLKSPKDSKASKKDKNGISKDKLIQSQGEIIKDLEEKLGRHITAKERTEQLQEIRNTKEKIDQARKIFVEAQKKLLKEQREKDAKITQQKKTIDKLTQQVTTLNNTCNREREQKVAVQNELNESRDHVAELHATLPTLRESMDKLMEDMRTLLTTQVHTQNMVLNAAVDNEGLFT